MWGSPRRWIWARPQGGLQLSSPAGSLLRGCPSSLWTSWHSTMAGSPGGSCTWRCWGRCSTSRRGRSITRRAPDTIALWAGVCRGAGTHCCCHFPCATFAQRVQDLFSLFILWFCLCAVQPALQIEAYVCKVQIDAPPPLWSPGAV